MKRSEINAALREMEAMLREYRFALPDFCHFTPEEWNGKGHEYDEVRDCMLGWDITDYGMGDFDKVGFSLITIRNGNRSMPDNCISKTDSIRPCTFTGRRWKTSSTAAAGTS